MRVTFVLPGVDLSGGVKVVATYARMLSERGHEVKVVYPKRPLTPNPRSWASKVKNAWRMQLNANRGHFAGIQHLLRPIDLAGQAETIGMLRPIDPNDVPDGDVIVATYWETAYWIADYPAIKGTPYYLIQHYETWDCDEQTLAKMQGSWRLPMQKLVVARWLRELAAREFDDPDAVLLHNGVDLARFATPVRDMNQPAVVGYTYSWAPWKRSDLIAEAVSLVRRESPDVRVRTFGQYRPADRMPYPEDGRHVLQPRQEEIPGLYAAADVWVVGSDSEGFGLPVLEAMACRTPVVTTEADGTVDIAADCPGAMLVPTGNATAMSEALLRVLMERDVWPTRSEAARRRATCFRWDRACDALEATLMGQPTHFDAVADPVT
jgi:glycosyltransferase involved in cell wall biosynthesis